MNESERKYHEVANIFPLMQGEEFEGLKADIAANGQLEPVWLHPDGSIIDGRNRHRACVELGITPKFRTWDGNGSLVAFVVSLNLHRRHLTTEQRVAIAQDILPMLEEEARQRQGRRTDLRQNGEDLFGGTSVQDCTEVQRSSDEAAQIMGVSARYIAEGKRIKEQAPEIHEMMRSGVVNVPAAKRLAGMDAPERAVVLQTLKDEGVDRITTKVLNEKEILEAAKQIRQQRAEQRREERVEMINEISQNNAPLDLGLDKLYPVIYADPPWRYEHSQTINREIENHYPTMTLEEICALPVANIATPHSILYLWTTSPKLEESMKVLKSWGFTYRTCFVWVKDRIGMGYYARQRHELLLVAKRGEFPVPETDNRFDSVIESPRKDHSAKPEIVYEMIEQMHPEFAKIELFARNKREGWAQWGNQA